jgi:hypothetical protein
MDNATGQINAIHLGSVYVPGAPSIRLHVADYNLGKSSYLTLTSLADGEMQRLDAQSLPEWYEWSATFNGDEVDVSLHVAPGDAGVFVEVDQVRTPEPLADKGPGTVASICGDNDDRVGSNDSRVARMPSSGCTGWLVSNGAVLSAGHCPVAAGDVIEFNVPPSQANGTTVAASTNDQYPINMGTVTFQSDGRGRDWMVFGVNRNANTGARAHLAQGFFYMTTAAPAIGATLRVTGCGLDNLPGGPGGPGAPCCDADGDGNCEFNCNATSQTQQTATGPLDDLDGTIIEHDVDTTPANSGSPIIWEATGAYTIGIHTQGGCDDFISGFDNHGTRFNHGPLANAVHGFLGLNTVYAIGFSSGLPANGGVFEPFQNVNAAVTAVPHGGRIGLVPGNYPRASGNAFTAGADGKSMTFVAPAGPAVIGN